MQSHTVGTQERSQETGNDSRRKRPFQREDRYHQASIKEKKGREGEEKREDTTSSTVAGEDRKALDTTEEKTAG